MENSTADGQSLHFQFNSCIHAFKKKKRNHNFCPFKRIKKNMCLGVLYKRWFPHKKNHNNTAYKKQEAVKIKRILYSPQPAGPPGGHPLYSPSCVQAPRRFIMFLCLPIIFIISISDTRSDRSFSVASSEKHTDRKFIQIPDLLKTSHRLVGASH